MTRAVDRSPSRVYAGPCHVVTDGIRCDRPLYAWFNVWRTEGDTNRIVICDGFRLGTDAYLADKGCGAEHTPADRADWIIADLTDRLDTLTFWQRWLPLLMPKLTWPARSTWWNWRRTDRLVPHGLTRDADELFRGGDVIGLVEREQVRIRRSVRGHDTRRERQAV